MAHQQGLFSWVDLTVPDTRAASDFYHAVLGWEAESVPGSAGSPPYVFFRKDGRKAAGMGELTEEQRPRGERAVWSSYIAVDDIDAATQRAGELGAEVVVTPTDVTDAGRMAFFKDPTGAAVGFWQAGQHEGVDAFDEPGFATWFELATSNVDQAAEFYSTLFGWSADRAVFEGGFEYTTFNTEDQTAGGSYDLTGILADGTPAHWTVYFSVEDTDVAVAAARERGATILREPADSPFGRVAAIADPQGATFQIIALADSTD